MVKRGLHKESAYPGLQRLIKDFYTAVESASESPIPAEDILTVALARDELIGTALPGMAPPMDKLEVP